MLFKTYILKRRIEGFFIYPFIIIGRLLSVVKPQSKEYENYFFFPFYHTGGAEKVHSLITQSVRGQNSIVIFTRRSVDKKFYNEFTNSGCAIKDISRFTDNKFLYFLNLIYRGIMSGYINKQKERPLVFNGQCNFAYKISPWIKTGIPQVELIHSFNTFSWIRIPFLPFITQSIMISRVRIEDHLRQYKKLKIPKEYYSRIRYIINGIALPEGLKKKNYTGQVKVLYVGRGTEEKRVQLIADIAKNVLEKELPVEFVLIGDVQEAIPAALVKYCHLLGHKSDDQEISQEYEKAHIVIITSSTEGFPMVIEEGMARECAVLATPVGDIPIHVKNGENGFLFSSVTDETLIVKEGVDFLTLLVNDRELLQRMGQKNGEYARLHFDIENFNKSYQQLFKQLRAK